jgi:hypothetical protein
MTRPTLLLAVLLGGGACAAQPTAAVQDQDLRTRCLAARERAIDGELERAVHAGADLAAVRIEQHRTALRVALGDEYLDACVGQGGTP